MSKIVIGESDGHNVSIDLDLLLSTRALLTADSGGGKTFALKRIVEQAFGKIQIIILDPEGEFSPLREKLDFVLVGKGGETPADVRSAALVAQTILKLRACVIVDLYEMKPSERHAYVRAFIDALIEAPKEMRHPCLVIVDEAHIFCPEHGKGESVASESMIGLCTRGRKRLLCPLFATQRLATLSKDASSMLLNRMIGPTFEDINRKRAADVLGIAKDGQKEFYKQIQTLEPGNFFCLGRAISKEMVLTHIGPIETPHGQEALKYEMKPPPAPEKIKALLPKLADLPKEAEEKAKSIAELQKQVRELKAELKQRPTETQQVVEEKIVEIPVLRPEQIVSLSYAIREVQQVATVITNALATVRKAPPVPVNRPRLSLPAPRPQVTRQLRAPQNGNGNDSELTGPERKILRALAELRSIGKEQPPKTMVAAWSSYSPEGGAFGNPMGSLRSKGYIDYPQPGTVVLTDAGEQVIGTADAPDQDEIWRRIEATCTGPEQKILKALIENAGEGEIAKADLAEKAGYSPVGGAFGNPIGALRTKGLLDYPRQGMVRAADWLFIA